MYVSGPSLTAKRWLAGQSWSTSATFCEEAVPHVFHLRKAAIVMSSLEASSNAGLD